MSLNTLSLEKLPTASENHCRMIWVRHGQTTWNAEKRFQGHLDIALNQAGIEQAHRLAARLSTLQKSLKLSCLYSSDLSRAKDTAASISEHMGQAIHTKPALRERNFGVVAGMTAEEMHILHPHTAKQLHLRIPEAELPGGESLLDFHTRIINTTCDLIKQHAGETIVIVSHGGVIDCVRRWALNIPLQYQRDWQLPNASINIVDADNEGAEVKVWADTKHLKETILDEANDTTAT